MIELSGVSKTFHVGRHNQFTAVDDVSLSFPQGCLTVLKGPSGSGKTTLLSLIGCMARPSSGRIRLRYVRTSFSGETGDGGVLDVTSLPERFLAEVRRTTFGFIFQHFNLVHGISALENVMLPAYPTGEAHGTFRKRAVELLERFGVVRQASSNVELLSGGEMQRVAIARALINDPAVIIADEPTAHLDSRISGHFMESIATLKTAGKTVVIASHDPLVCDSRLVDALVGMRDGRITGKFGPA